MNRLVFPSMLLISMLALSRSAFSEAPPRPNVLWITSEDNGPQLGCYGDDYATTPNLDELAARAVMYRTCWSNVPVCAPARTAIITGMYPTSLGAQHMRSMTKLPPGMKMYPQYLRAAGYYCTNNSKEDYNVAKPGKVWDESSGKAHWNNRAAGQPFFAIFNHTVSHESQVRRRPHKAVHDPAEAPLPAYHPDAQEVRQDWAQYYDKLTEMDAQAGEDLRELAEAGLADDTIVFYYGDHGPGMPRGKRSPCDSGMHVPLIVYIPEKFKHLRPDDYAAGGTTDRLVSFVDLAPTLLSLCGIAPPSNMQGRAFAGEHAAPPRAYIYGLRGRMDERYDMARTVGDGRYVYIRNFMPHRPAGQYVAYMHQTPTTRVWKQMYDAGELNDAQSHFWQPKPSEELYDLTSDPDEVNNLADSAEHRDVLERMRAAHRDWTYRTRDLGYLPESEIHRRAAGSAPYDMAQDPAKYPLKKIKPVADLATSPERDSQRNAESPSSVVEQLIEALDNQESAIRFWAVRGLLIRGDEAVATAHDALRSALNDPSPDVRIESAEARGRYGKPGDVEPVLQTLMPLASPRENGIHISRAALNAIDFIDPATAPLAEQLAALPRNDPQASDRMKDDVNKLLEKILADLGRE